MSVYITDYFLLAFTIPLASDSAIVDAFPHCSAASARRSDHETAGTAEARDILRLCQLLPFLPRRHETLEYYESTLESTSGSYMKMYLFPWLMLRGFGGSATSLQMSL